METSNKLPKKRKWFIPLVFSLLLTTLVVFVSIFTSPYFSSSQLHRAHLKNPIPRFVESKLTISKISSDPVPRLAYLISGSTGDGKSLMRALKALYHPRNQYAVHLDLEAPAAERLELANFVKNEPVFKSVGNVRMVLRANLVTYRGPTMVTNTLHAAAILLKDGGDWDWFINLSASDYPLVTQDGIYLEHNNSFKHVGLFLLYVSSTSSLLIIMILLLLLFLIVVGSALSNLFPCSVRNGGIRI